MFAMVPVFPPHMIRKMVAHRALHLLWEDNVPKNSWKCFEDAYFCGERLEKKVEEFTEKECLIIEMLCLKYADQPCEEDLSKERVLN